MADAEVFPIINCRDIRETKAFYEIVFSAKLNYQFPENGDPDFLMLSAGNGTVGLGVGTEAALYGKTPLPATGNAIDLCIYVPDLAAVDERALEQGAQVPVEPQSTPWDEKIAYVQDPEGTMLLVIQSPAKPA